MFVNIVLKDAAIEFDKEYLYKVPDELVDRAVPGSCVIVPFGKSNKQEKGFILSFSEDAESGYFIKPIIKICEPSPMLTSDQLVLVRKVVQKYSCSYGDAIRLMIPPDTEAGKTRSSTVYLADEQEAQMMASEGDFSNIGQLRAVEYLLEYGESLQNDVITSCQISKSTLSTLKKKGVVHFGRISQMPQHNILKQKSARSRFELTSEQKQALLSMTKAGTDGYKEFLLFGITGSGKTEVYLELIKYYLDRNLGSILLVPEISLTPQMTARLENRFGDNVRVLHSRLTSSERNRRWQDVLSKKAKVVAGARSAVFAPVSDLKLVIIDEEQESSYKSETHPRYHAYEIGRAHV